MKKNVFMFVFDLDFTFDWIVGQRVTNMCSVNEKLAKNKFLRQNQRIRH